MAGTARGMRARPFALAGAGAAASAVAIALIRLRRPIADRAKGAAGRLGAGASASASAEPETYRCDCGQEFRVAGIGRHRVYWLAGAPDDDPVLAPSCPACDRPLPRESELEPAAR
jgi:hypothetical protein